MKRINPYLAILVTVLLVAGPWLQLVQAMPATVDSECSCCEGACQGCCCSPTPAESDCEKSPESGCQCNFTDVPVLPDLPQEHREHRSDRDDSRTTTPTPSSSRITTSSSNDLRAPDDSPPIDASPPAYLLFGAFLS